MGDGEGCTGKCVVSNGLPQQRKGAGELLRLIVEGRDQRRGFLVSWAHF
jgi:hypothetical protein